jgi:hypothetical protein
MMDDEGHRRDDHRASGSRASLPPAPIADDKLALPPGAESFGLPEPNAAETKARVAMVNAAGQTLH